MATIGACVFGAASCGAFFCVKFHKEERENKAIEHSRRKTKNGGIKEKMKAKKPLIIVGIVVAALALIALICYFATTSQSKLIFDIAGTYTSESGAKTTVVVDGDTIKITSDDPNGDGLELKHIKRSSAYFWNSFNTEKAKYMIFSETGKETKDITEMIYFHHEKNESGEWMTLVGFTENGETFYKD